MVHRPLRITLASPRGFCAGVERAIALVENAVDTYDTPVFVRHEIVHNPHVINKLRERGVVFVDELSSVPDGTPVIFSAHGVSPGIIEEAQHRNLPCIDATCPLVKKVHREVMSYIESGKEIILIGHKNHPEVVGILGYAPKNKIHLVETVDDIQQLNLPKETEVGLVTQTTLSIFETSHIVAALKQRFSQIQEPRTTDICYATTNRQLAAIELAKQCDTVIVIGGNNSSNSASLKEIVLGNGCRNAFLIESASQFELSSLEGVRTLGITSGASTPEILVTDLVAKLTKHFDVTISELVVNEENVHFNTKGHDLRRNEKQSTSYQHSFSALTP